MLRIYNDWLHDFCKRRARPARRPGQHPELQHRGVGRRGERCAKRGVRGLDIANRPDMTPLWDPCWEPLWEFGARAGMPLHFHTIGGRSPDYSKMPQHVVRRVQAAHITGFQMHMSNMLMSLIFSGAPERHPNLKIVIGEAGLGWIPYVLQHMDLEWEDQFQDLDLKMKPSEYWHRQFYATYQTDPVGIRAARRPRRGQRHVGLGLPASRRHLARSPGVPRAASSTGVSRRGQAARSCATTR